MSSIVRWIACETILDETEELVVGVKPLPSSLQAQRSFYTTGTASVCMLHQSKVLTVPYPVFYVPGLPHQYLRVHTYHTWYLWVRTYHIFALQSSPCSPSALLMWTVSSTTYHCHHRQAQTAVLLRSRQWYGQYCGTILSTVRCTSA